MQTMTKRSSPAHVPIASAWPHHALRILEQSLICQQRTAIANAPRVLLAIVAARRVVRSQTVLQEGTSIISRRPAKIADVSLIRNPLHRHVSEVGHQIAKEIANAPRALRASRAHTNVLQQVAAALVSIPCLVSLASVSQTERAQYQESLPTSLTSGAPRNAAQPKSRKR